MNTGAFGENFPYSNFHDLNMDWIIKIAKDFLDQYTHIQEVIASGEESLQNLTEEGLNQLQEKAETLENLLQAWYDTHSEDIANQLADAITAFGLAAEQKAQDTIATIPEDYTALSNRVVENEHIMETVTHFFYNNLLESRTIDGSHNGIRFTSVDKNVVHVYGTNNASSAAHKDLIELTDPVPATLIPGHYYYAIKHFSDSVITYRMYFYESSDLNTLISSINLADGERFQIPSNTGAIRISLYVSAGVTVDEYIGVGYSTDRLAYLTDIDNSFGDVLKYKGLATAQTSTETRTVTVYNDTTGEYEQITVTSKWMDTLRTTGMYNIRTVESRSLYDIPDLLQGMPSFLMVLRISDRTFQTITGAGGHFYRMILDSDTSTLKPWISLSQSIPEPNTLPEYWRTQIKQDVIDIIKEQKDSAVTGDSIIAFSDFHYQYNAGQSPQIMELISNQCGIGKIFFCGDLINHFLTDSMDDVIQAIVDSRKLLENIADRMYSVTGNHEHHIGSQPEYNPGYERLYSMLCKSKELEYGWVDSFGNYWIENTAQKIRYFFVQCNSATNISTASATSVVNELSNVPNGYTVVLITHHALTDTGAIYDHNGIKTILTALNNFNLGNQIKTACVLSGHLHLDIDNTTDYLFPVIGITTDAYGKRASGAPSMTLGTTTEQAFDIVFIDTNNKTVKTHRIGAGQDRSYTYA